MARDQLLALSEREGAVQLYEMRLVPEAWRPAHPSGATTGAQASVAAATDAAATVALLPRSSVAMVGTTAPRRPSSSSAQRLWTAVVD